MPRVVCAFVIPFGKSILKAPRLGIDQHKTSVFLPFYRSWLVHISTIFFEQVKFTLSQEMGKIFVTGDKTFAQVYAQFRIRV